MINNVYILLKSFLNFVQGNNLQTFFIYQFPDKHHARFHHLESNLLVITFN